jgi:hypothetical protein
MPVATTDITLLGLLLAVALVAVLATSIGYTRGKKDGEREANSLPRTWCTEYALFSDEGRVCRYSAADGSEYSISKVKLQQFLGGVSPAQCPKRVRLCFFQHADVHQVISVEVLQP